MHHLHEMLSVVGDAEDMWYVNQSKKRKKPATDDKKDNFVKSSYILRDAITLHNEVIG